MNILKSINSLYYPNRAVKLPTVVMIEPADSCTLKCIMCDVQQRKNTLSHFITIPQLEHILGQFPEIRELIFCGVGEPLLNKDIIAMIEAAKKRKVPFINMVTNGELLKPDISQKLIDSGLDQLHISVPAVTEDTFKKIRNNPTVSLSLLSENIKYMTRMKRQSSGKPKIIVNIVMMNCNAPELKDAVMFCKDLGVNGICFVQLTTIFGNKERININKKGISVLFREIRKLGREFGMEIGFLTGNEYGRCYQLWDFIMVHADGTISPCNGIMPTQKVIDWNIFQGDIKDVWISKAYQSLRDKARTSSLENCRFCESGYLIEGLNLKWLINFYARPIRNCIVKKIKNGA